MLLLDEPFTGVDVGTQEAILTALDQLRAQQVTVLFATHDLQLASQRFDLVLLLNRKLVAYGPPAQVLAPETLKLVFGPQMLLLPGGTAAVDQTCWPEDKED